MGASATCIPTSTQATRRRSGSPTCLLRRGGACVCSRYRRSLAMWKIAAQRRRPIGPPARPAIPRASSGRPPASASLGQSADVFWQAGHTNLVSYIGVSLRGRTTGQYARARGDAAEAAAAARRLLPLKLGGAAAERQAGSTAATRCMATATRTSRLSVCYSPLRWHRHGHGRLLEII